MTELKTPHGIYRITQGFGARPLVYRQFGMNGHNGYDFVGMPRNYAIAAGQIIENGFDKNGYGYYIKIQTDDGFIDTYAHFATPTSIRGRVELWQDLGSMGTTGFSSGVHLHITRKPLNSDKGNGYQGAIDFGNYLEKLNNSSQESNQPITKKRMKITNTQRAVWFKHPKHATGEIWVIEKHKTHPLETRHKVESQKSVVALTFGINDAYERLEGKEIDRLFDLTEGVAYDINNEAITHPEYFELQ